MYKYTGICILSILWEQKQESTDVHVHWVMYLQYSLETERKKDVHLYCILNIVLKKQKEEQILVHLY